MLARSMAWPPAMPAWPAEQGQQRAQLGLQAPEGTPLVGREHLEGEGLHARRPPAWPGPRRTARARWACPGAARRCPCTACRRASGNKRGSARPRRRRAQRGLAVAAHGLRRRPAPAAGAGACRRRARHSAWPGRGRPARCRAPRPTARDSTVSSSARSHASKGHRSCGTAAAAYGNNLMNQSRGLQLTALEQPDLGFHGVQSRTAEIQQFGPSAIAAEQLVERHCAALHRLPPGVPASASASS